ncbi:hypothetical protein B0J18DRAFT_304181 [Chaetomium sp. MPI-SDFR-AT-0129]|nr:hypothetical protein B0J18DRAFT_304181 [Chaetomium sp. MPI-SDFR-AT-0129]
MDNRLILGREWVGGSDQSSRISITTHNNGIPSDVYMGLFPNPFCINCLHLGIITMAPTISDHPHTPVNLHNARKLRDSCTDCANSKVKCSKEKPTCARCARREVTCTYSVSRRSGRTASQIIKAARLEICQPPRGPPRVNNLISPRKTTSPSTAATVTPQKRPRTSRGSPRPSSPEVSPQTRAAETASLLLQAAARSDLAPLFATGHSNSMVGAVPEPNGDWWTPDLPLDVSPGTGSQVYPLPLAAFDTDGGFHLDTDLGSFGVHNQDESDSTRASLGTETPVSPDLYGAFPPYSSSEIGPEVSAVFDHFDSGNVTRSMTPTYSNGSCPGTCLVVAFDILTRVSSESFSKPPAATRTIKADHSETLSLEHWRGMVQSLIAILNCHCSQGGHLAFPLALASIHIMRHYLNLATKENTIPSPDLRRSSSASSYSISPIAPATAVTIPLFSSASTSTTPSTPWPATQHHRPPCPIHRHRFSAPSILQTLNIFHDNNLPQHTNQGIHLLEQQPITPTQPNLTDLNQIHLLVELVTTRLAALRSPYPTNTAPTQIPTSPTTIPGLSTYPSVNLGFGAEPGGLGCEVPKEMGSGMPEGRYGMAVFSEQTLLGLEQDVRRWCQAVSWGVFGGNRGS